MKSKTPIKLDLSYGILPDGHAFVRPKGFDPRDYPWRFSDESVEEAYSAFLINRIPGPERPTFMDELHRVLVPGGKVTVIVPYWTSYRAISDYESAWPPIVEQSFLYFNKKFREDNRLGNDCKADFDFSYGFALDPETATRPDETRPFWIKHYCGAVNDLQVILTKR